MSKPEVIAIRGTHYYLVRFEDGDTILDTKAGTLSPKLPQGSWVKDAYWDSATMPDEVLVAWLARAKGPAQ